MRAKRVVVAILLASINSGCWASIDTTPHRSESPDSSRAATRREERDQRVEVDLEYSESAIQVLAEDRTKCRDVTMQPYVATIHTERKLTPTGRLIQYTNVGGALLLGLVGGILAAGYCTPSNSSSSGSSGSTGTGSTGNGSTNQQQQCTPDEINSAKNAGYVTLGLAAIPTAFFVINALRASDSDDEEAAPTRSEPGQWKTCAARPLVDEPVTIVLADGSRVVGRTKENGRALVDLSGIDGAAAMAHPQADVVVGGSVRGQADLSKLGLFAQWKAAAAAEAQRRAEAARAEAAARMAQCIPNCVREYEQCAAAVQSRMPGAGNDAFFMFCGSEPGPGMVQGRCEQACSGNRNYRPGSILPK